MADFPNQLQRYGNRGLLSPAGQLTPFDGFSAITEIGFQDIFVAPTANLAYYLPIRVGRPCTALDILLQVISASGNLDVGIYEWDGTRLVSSGSTAVGAAGVQKVAITDTALSPGWYLIAFACDNASALFRTCTLASGSARVLGWREEASAFPLPATATFAAHSTANVPNVAATVVSAA